MEAVRWLVLKREKKFYGCLVDYAVMIDDDIAGYIRNGETKTFELDYKKHIVHIVIQRDGIWTSKKYEIGEGSEDYQFNIIKITRGTSIIIELERF